MPYLIGSSGRMRLPSEAIKQATLTLYGFLTGTDIVILLAGTDTVVHQVNEVSGTTYDYTYDIFTTGAPVVDIGFIKPGYKVKYLRSYQLQLADAEVPITLETDLNYQG